MGTTKQRRAILAILSASSGHMTVEQVFEKARQAFPNIGKGTIYRNLSLMADTGEIRRLHIAGEPTRFDRNTLPHQHVVCVECGDIIDIADIEREKIQNLTDPRVKIVECTLIIYALCEQCAIKTEKG